MNKNNLSNYYNYTSLIKIGIFVSILLLLLLNGCTTCKEDEQIQYEPSWKSLKQIEIPQWVKDSKFGIYAHWGVYSVGIGPPWTEKHLYNPDYQKGELLKRFEKLTGHSLKDGYGYKDLIKYFKAENYDPVAWAELIKKSGAKFAGFSISHHDGFGLWDSDIYKWNVGKMGPKRDLYGELVKELRKQNIKVYATSHMYRTYGWMNPPKKFLEQAKKEKWDILDPKYKDFYWSNLNGGDKNEFYKFWNLKIREVIDKYHPDLFWFDGGKFRENKAYLKTFAYYFNQAEKRNQKVCIANKFSMSRTFNFPFDFGIYNFESGRDRPVEVDRYWMDDLNITGRSWGYTGYEGAHTSSYVIRQLIDNVSRGGGLVVSLAPRIDGTIPEAQKQTLLEIGEWLQQNGEAIFGTQRWYFSSDENAEETAEKYIYKYRTDKDNLRWNFDKMGVGSIRYTQKADTVVYILSIGIPKKNTINAKRFSSKLNLFIGEIANVILLGSDEKINWVRNKEGLKIDLPKKLPNNKSLVFKVVLHK